MADTKLTRSSRPRAATSAVVTPRRLRTGRQPDPPARHRREQTEINLEKLLSSAAGLMARQGYDQTSIRDVGRETGFSLAGMYYYFSGKEELLYKIQDQTFGTLLREQEALAAEGGDPEEILRRLVRNHVSYLTTHSSELKVCTFELESLQGAYYRKIERLRRRYFKLMAGLVGELMGRPAGSGKANGEVRHHALFLFGMLNWVFMWFDPRRDGPVEDLGNRMVDQVLYGLPAARPRRRRLSRVTNLRPAGTPPARRPVLRSQEEKKS